MNDILEIIRPRLLSLVAEGTALARVSHPGIKGRLREILIQNAIEPFLPPSVRVLTGTIVAASGERTYRVQDDLVLFSLKRAPLLLNLGEQSIMPIGGVIDHIEVKSTLKRDDLRSAVNAAAELRNLASGKAPGGIVFAYRSDSQQDEVERLLDVQHDVKFNPDSGQASSPIQMICVADKGTWILSSFNGKSGWWRVRPFEQRHLLTFCSILSNHTYREEEDRNGIGDYLLDIGWLEGPSPECPVLVP